MRSLFPVTPATYRQNERPAALLLNEMISRISKNLLREKLRLVTTTNPDDYNTVKKLWVRRWWLTENGMVVVLNLLHSQSHQVVAQFFNMLFGSGKESEFFWTTSIKLYIRLKYGGHLGQPLSDAERAPGGYQQHQNNITINVDT